MRVLIALAVLIFGLLHTLNDQLATFQAPKPDAVPTLSVVVSQPILVAPVSTPTPSNANSSNVLEQLFGAVTSWLGTPYQWGGCSHKTGIDCSCFVQNVLAVIGIHAPRVTVDQIRWASPVSASDARVGDLVFFDNTCSNCGANPTHVGLYLGAGRMADCGDPCKIEPVYSGHNARYARPPGL